MIKKKIRYWKNFAPFPFKINLVRWIDKSTELRSLDNSLRKIFPFRSKSSLILPRNVERDRYEEYVGLKKISPLVTSHQSSKVNYSHMWVDRVMRTKIQIFSKFTQVLSC
jgi:hypothetical protein